MKLTRQQQRRYDRMKKKQKEDKRPEIVAFRMILAMNLIILHDVFGFGQTRCARFANKLIEMFIDHSNGLFELDELFETVKNELGVDI